MLLGSAQCERCGRSVLGSVDAGPAGETHVELAVEGAVDDQPIADIAAPLLSPPQRPPPRPAPPPPPGLSPPLPPHAIPRTAASGVPQRRLVQAGPGCAVAVLLAALAAAVVGVFAVTRAGTDATNEALEDVFEGLPGAGGSSSFDGRRDVGPPLVVGTSAEHALPADAVGEHRLDGVEGRVTVRVVGTDDFDPVVQVVAADGAVLGEDDDGGDSLDARLSVVLPGGVSTVLVREFGGDAGNYSVLVQRGDDIVGIEPASGPPLALGATVDGTVAADSTVAHDFEAPGGVVRITVQGIDGFDAVIRIRSGDDVLVEEDDTIGVDPRVDLDLAAGQPVVMEVFGFGGRAGRYRVVVERPTG